MGAKKAAFPHVYRAVLALCCKLCFFGKSLYIFPATRDSADLRGRGRSVCVKRFEAWRGVIPGPELN